MTGRVNRSQSYSSAHSHPASMAPAPATRASSTHLNSSAFSSSAGPDEDWTQISDLAERRRIQNRIAQRNYRKKLKRRLEDLERKATSVSPEPNPSELDRRSKSLEDYYDEESRSGYVSRRATSPESRHPSSQYERSLFSHQYLRPPSPTLPPVSYPTSNSALPPVSYAGAPASQQPMRYAPLSTSSEYLSNFPTHAGTQQYGHYYSDPSWSSVTRSVESNGVKQEDYEEELGPLHPSYSHMSGMELAQFQQQQQQQQQQQRQQQQKQQQRSHQQHYQQTWQGHNHHNLSLPVSDSSENSSPTLSSLVTPPLSLSSDSFDPFEELPETTDPWSSGLPLPSQEKEPAPFFFF